MRRTNLLLAIGVAAVAALWAQHLWAQQLGAQQRTSQPPSQLPAYEVKSILPRETSPAQYQQVDLREVEAATGQGWELVSVMPYIYKNEERGTTEMAPRPMVTQTYPAYFFKRPKTDPLGSMKNR